MPDYTFDIDYSDDIARLTKHPGYTTLPPRTETRYFTLHYSGVQNTDRSRTAELNRILNEARYQLHHDYSGNGSGAYPDGLLYDCVVLSDGTCVKTRAHPVQLWHCGNTEGNAKSFAGHLMLGPGQDATLVQWQRMLRVIDEVRAVHGFPAYHIVGHCEWPRHRGLPRPSAIYTVLPEQSECPGRILHARLVAARADSLPPPPTPPFSAYTADSMILGSPHATPGQAAAYILSRPHTNYEDGAIADTIVPTYYAVCRSVGVDAVLAIAQMIHETGNLTSFWSARGKGDNDQRNPAGIGVTGAHQRPRPRNTERWAYNPVKRWWEVGEGFATWKDHAIPAHIGRLLAYALPHGTGTPEQRTLIQRALAVRALPSLCQGSAPILRYLGRAENPHGDQGCGWAGKDTSEGAAYGSNIAAIANAITRMPL